EQLIPRLASALQNADAERAMKFFGHRLEEILQIECGDAGDETRWDTSDYWCRDFGSSDRPTHGFREYIGLAFAKLAADLAGQSSERADSVLSFLADRQRPAFRRVEYHVLGSAGVSAAAFLDSVIGDTDCVYNDFPGAEYLRVLSSRFAQASEH